MAPRKKTLVATSEEIEEAGLKKDFFSDRRNSDGYIKLSFNEYGAQRMAQAAERRIEQRQAEIDQLRSQHKKFEKLEDKLETKAKEENKKKSKKDKKREKKEKKRLKNLPESSRILFAAVEEYTDRHHKSKKDRKKEREEFEGVSEKVKPNRAPKEKTPEQEEAERKRKEAKDQMDFEMKFDEPITLHRQTIIEVDKTLQEISMMLEETKLSRARNRNVMIKDLLSAKGSLLGNRISSANGIASIQKTKLDAAAKKADASKGEQNEKNQNINLLAKAFPQLVSGGLASASVSAAGGKGKGKDKDDVKDDKDKDKGKGGKKKEKRRSQEDDDDFMSTATKLIKSGDFKLTPHEAAIGIEGKYKVAIKKSFSTQEWKFIAIDHNGNEIANFKEKHPGVLPKRKDHDIRFDDDKDIARCRRTDQMFQVIQVPYM
jgi:hypothetical protein